MTYFITELSMFPAMATLTFILLFLVQFPSKPFAQQSYVNNKQLNCLNNDSTTLGFICNGAATSCPSYITFRSTQTYNTAVTIAYLLSADAAQIAAVNSISDVEQLKDDTLVIVPVNCSCFGERYYQHTASYTLKVEGEAYFTVANDTYQALSTCQAMEEQNVYDTKELVPNMRINVPLRCACPTRNQTGAGFRYLLTYLVRQGEFGSSIADFFSGAGADVQSIYEANELSPDQTIYFFTPILVPLKTEPTKDNINTTAAPPPPPPPPSEIPTTTLDSQSNNSSRKRVFIGVGIGASILILLSGLALFFFRRNRRKKSPPPPPKLSDKPTPPPSWSLSISSEGIRNAIETLNVYKFEDLEKATNSFAEENRIDGSSVYLGLFNGDYAAVKVMKGAVPSEIDVLRQINHLNIIRLSGFCVHQGVTYLIYEYAKEGSVKRNLKRLDWKQRVQIAYDVSDALNYLHNFTNPPYIHKNLSSSNILLDSNFRAKIINFGLARSLDESDQAAVTRHVVGTKGYMPPEYIENGLVTPKMDVFALGVVMLELLSGKEPITNGEKLNEESIKYMLCESIENVFLGDDNVREKLVEFMDSSLGEEDYPLELAYAMAQLARSCVSRNVNDRPLVSQVLMSLSKILSSSLDWDPSIQSQNSTSFTYSN